jgi:two-component system, LytTR family, sensor kinase
MKFFWRYIFPVLFGLLIYASIRLVNDTTAQEKFWERPLITNLIEIFTVIFVSYLLQYVLSLFTKKFSSDSTKPINGKTILKEFLTVFIVCQLLMNVTVTPMAALTDDGLGWNDVAIINIIPALYVMLYFAIVRGNYYLTAYVDNKLLLQKLTNDKLQTELKFLKAQYHPHFLFNALNTVYFQMDESVEGAKKSIEQFSSLLRYQLYDQQQTVSIRQELDYMSNFIELQQARTSDKLKLNVSVDPLLNGQQVYPLLLLPLVENAFKYVGGDYHLSIAAKADGEKICFTVENSLNQEISTTQNHGGIGLENLKRRLMLLYPGKHDLVIEKADSYFKATLSLDAKPFIPEQV